MTDTTSFHWEVSLAMREDEDHCEVTAHLDTQDRSFVGKGRSRRNPRDPMVPQVGEQLATARALHDLANHLVEDAWGIIEAFDPNG